MLEEKIRNLISHSVRVERFRTISGRRDPSLSPTILFIGKMRTTRDIREAYSVIISPPKKLYKMAASVCRLRHIDFCVDYRTIALAIAVQIATVDCVTVGNMRDHDWNLEGRL